MCWTPAWTPLHSATKCLGPPADLRRDHGRLVARARLIGFPAGAAIFAHIAARLQQTGRPARQAASVVLFDVDEHTGAFGGAKAYFEDRTPAAGSTG